MIYRNWTIVFFLLVIFSSCGDSTGKDFKEEDEELTENGEKNDVFIPEEETTEYLYVFKDFFPGVSGDFVQNVFSSNGKRFFFSVYRNSTREAELWISDGTEEGTRKVDSFGWISSEPLDGKQSNYAYLHNEGAAITSDYFYFLAGPDRSRVNLYGTDGTPGNSTLLRSGINNSSSTLHSYNNKVYFDAPTEDQKVELFEADDRNIVQITHGGGGHGVSKIVEENGKIYFVHSAEQTIYEWDGQEVRNVVPGLASERLIVFENGIEVLGNKIYFYAFKDKEPYTTGFYSADISSGEFDKIISHSSGVNYDHEQPHLTKVNNGIYFAAPGPGATKQDFTGKNIKEISIWRVDNAGQPIQVKQLRGDKEYSPYVSFEFSDFINGYLLFDKFSSPYPSGKDQGEILYSLNSQKGQTEILDTLRNDFQHYFGAKTSTHLYYGGWRVNNHSEPIRLWRTDGTKKGTESLKNVDGSDYKFNNDSGIAVLGRKVFFVGDGETGTDLWVFDEEKYPKSQVGQ